MLLDILQCPSHTSCSQDSLAQTSEASAVTEYASMCRCAGGGHSSLHFADLQFLKLVLLWTMQYHRKWRVSPWPTLRKPTQDTAFLSSWANLKFLEKHRCGTSFSLVPIEDKAGQIPRGNPWNLSSRRHKCRWTSKHSWKMWNQNASILWCSNSIHLCELVKTTCMPEFLKCFVPKSTYLLICFSRNFLKCTYAMQRKPLRFKAVSTALLRAVWQIQVPIFVPVLCSLTQVTGSFLRTMTSCFPSNGACEASFCLCRKLCFVTGFHDMD